MKNYRIPPLLVLVALSKVAPLTTSTLGKHKAAFINATAGMTSASFKTTTTTTISPIKTTGKVTTTTIKAITTTPTTFKSATTPTRTILTTLALTSTTTIKTKSTKTMTTTSTTSTSTTTTSTAAGTLTSFPFTTTAAATTIANRCTLTSTAAPPASLTLASDANATFLYCAEMLASIDISEEVQFQPMVVPNETEIKWLHDDPDVWKYLKYAVEKFKVYAYPCGPNETISQAIYDLEVFNPYVTLPESLGFGVDYELFSKAYSDAYAASQILAQALDVFKTGLLDMTYVNVHLFNCHMTDYMYTYLFEHDINCGLKVWAKQVWYRYRFKICLVGEKIFDKTEVVPVEHWRNVIDLVDFAAPVYILLNILNLIVLQKMHTGSDSAAYLIYLAEVLCDLLVIPVSLQLQPTKLGQAIRSVLLGGTCPATSESKYENVYTLGENNMQKAIVEAVKTVFVDFSSLCLVILAIDRFIALRNPEKYGEKRGRKRFWYAMVLVPIFVLFATVAFLCFLLAAYFATDDKTQNKSGLAYCGYEGSRFFYLLSTALLMFIFSLLLVWKIVVRWRDANADSYRHSAILTLVCILIKLPTIAYRMSWVAAQMCIAFGMYLQYAKGVPIGDILWLNTCWTLNDQLYFWQSVAYYKVVSLVMLLNLCCSAAYRRALVRLLMCKSVAVTPVHAVHPVTIHNGSNPDTTNPSNRLVVLNGNRSNTNDPDGTSGYVTVTGVTVEELENTDGNMAKKG